MVELDDLVTKEGPDILNNRFITKGEVPGCVYIIDIPEEGATSMRYDYCTFYDQDNRRCSVYESRPKVCSTYGEGIYADCPFKDFTKEGELTEFLIQNKSMSVVMHKNAGTNPVKYLEDITRPFVNSFYESIKEHPEYKVWWDGLPEVNFIKDGDQ
jgi:hypothetical protein